MKKFIAFLLISTVLSISAQAQKFSSRVVKFDTTAGNATTKPGKFGLDKNDSSLRYHDGYSFKYVVTALQDSATIDFGQATSTTVTDVTKTVPGARLGDEVIVGVPHASITATSTFTAWVSAANTITIRYSPKATENPASGVFHYTVLKYKKFH